VDVNGTPGPGGATGRDTLRRFLVVGATTVLIDALVYQALLWTAVPHGPGKAAGFAAGALFAYVANWRFTFGGRSHRWSLAAFVAVYLCALGLNVAVNALVLGLLGGTSAWQVGAAFVLATGVSAAWNYVGMARVVFRSPPPAADPEPQEVVSRHG